MRRLSYLLTLCTILLWSCENGGDETNPGTPVIDTIAGCTDPLADNFNPEANADDCDCAYEGYSGMPDPPVTTERKLYFEEYGGEWCGWHIDGAEIMAELKEKYGDRMFVSSVHYNDFLENDDTNALRNYFDIESCPAALVNRNTGVAEHRSLWVSKAELAMEKPAEAQIAIETKLDGQDLEGVVYLDILADLPKKDYRLHLYLIEDGFNSRSQLNYFSNVYNNTAWEGHPFYDLPSPLSGEDYVHNNVLREIIIHSHKIAEKAINRDGVYTRKFKVRLFKHNYNKDKVRLISFITNSANTQILNVNGVEPGETVSW